jgi:hypothetical protein
MSLFDPFVRIFSRSEFHRHRKLPATVVTAPEVVVEVTPAAEVAVPKSEIEQRVEWMRKHNMRYQILDRDGGGYTINAGPHAHLGSIIHKDGAWLGLLSNHEIEYDTFPTIGEAADEIVAGIHLYAGGY